jgi:hypothetical protein
MMWRVESLKARAVERIDAFQEIASGISHESKGILFQEAFFVYAALGDTPPSRILESGRARGQSTLLLSKSFPERKIVSVEFDQNSEDVPVAEKRLAGESNIELRYGDARVLLPSMLEEGDVVVIDGPKEHRALALAYRILGTGRSPAVFIHDCYKGSPIRRLLEDHYPGAVFSDDPGFVSAYRKLDEDRINSVNETGDEDWRPYKFAGTSQVSWGPTFACLPYVSSYAYGMERCRVAVSAILWRLKRSVAKRSPKGMSL